jgi:hypothetical protein
MEKFLLDKAEVTLESSQNLAVSFRLKSKCTEVQELKSHP